MKKKLQKLLWTILLMVFAFNTLTPNVYAITNEVINIYSEEESIITNDVENKEQEVETSNFPTKEQVEDIQIIGEDASKRERNVKHFLTDKGTYQAFVYSSAVHYEVDGNWEDIDNTLITTKNENGEEVTQNTKNSFKVEFSNNIKENIFIKQDILKEEELIEQEKFIEKENLKEEQLLNEEDIQIEKIDKRKNINDSKIISIENDKFSMKWSMEETNKTELKQVDRDKIEITEDKKTNVNTDTDKEISRGETKLKNISSTVNYSNIIDGIDLEYDVSSDYVKETIVLKSANAVRDTFVFNMNMGDSTLILNEDNSIDILDDTGEKVALIEIPYMFDSVMEFSNDIKVTIEKDENLENNVYTMVIMPNLEWLQDKSRVYPIKIDPTITTNPNRDAQDAFIMRSLTNPALQQQNWGAGDPLLKVGKENDVIYRSLIKFNLPTLYTGDQIIGAGLSLCNYLYPSSFGGMSEFPIINVHKVTDQWERSSATWQRDSEKYNPRIVDYKLYDYILEDDYWFYQSIGWYFNTETGWNITDIVKDWYTTGNNGLMLKVNDESNANDVAWFYSTRSTSYYLDAGPMLIIEYRNQAGLENYLSYHEQDLGRAGIGYVNDYNGNLTVMHPDAVTPGNRMPASINHVYNTNDISRNWGFGTGWKLNITQMINIEMMQVFGEDVEYAKYLDEDGTIHYFERDEYYSNIYYEEDGLGLTLTKNADLSFAMEDKAGNKMTFERQILSGTEWWHLKEIKDVNGNKITISLSNNGSLFYPGTVTDGTGAVITINWTNGRVSSIVDQAGRTTSYTYDGNNRLVKITYPDSKEVNYTYDSKGLLLSTKNIDNSHIDYTYYQTVPYRVNTVKEYSTNNEHGNSLDISYGNNCTDFTDNRGYKIIYTFNNWGNLINVSDYGDNVNDLTKARGQSYTFGIDQEGAKNKLTFESTMMAADEDVISVNNLVQNPGFENGLTNWNRNADCNTSIDTVVNTSKGNALVLNGELWKYKQVKQTVNVSGEKGDVYSFSAWVKNTGILNFGGTINSLGASGGGSDILLLPNVVDNNSDWQYISGVFVTKSNYNGIDICISSDSQANQMWVKNISLIKDEGGQSYSYDEKGNLISTQDLAKQNSEFKYSNGNELIKQTNPKGGSYVYEYDSQYKNRLTNAVNNSKVKYSFEYDTYGNTTSSKISNNYETTSWVTDGGTYYIRAKSSGLYLKTNDATTEVSQDLLNTQTNQQWKISSTNDGYYEIQSVDKGKLLESLGNSGYIEASNCTGADNQKWKLELNSDGSFIIKPKIMENINAATMENDSTDNRVTLVEQKFEGKATQHFYFQEVEKALEQEFIESGEVYYLKNAYTQGYLDYNTQTDTNNTSMVQQNYKGSDSQKWRIMRNENGTYRLVSLFSKTGRALTNSNSNGNTTVLYDYSNYDINQEWVINRQADGKFIISSKYNSRNLAINNNTNDIGEAVITANSTGDISKYWVLEPDNMIDIEDWATYKIKNKNSELYIGVLDNGYSSSQIKQVKGGISEGQEWIFCKRNDGSYSILLNSPNWPMALTVASVDTGGEVSDEFTAILDRDDVIYFGWGIHKDSQKWEIVPAEDGTFYLKPRNLSGRWALDVNGASTTVGADLQICETNGNDNQKFYLEKVSGSGNENIESKAEYTQDGRFLDKLIDSRGKETKYTYNFNNQSKTGTGTLQSVTDPKGNITEHTYDNLDRLTNVSLTDGTDVYQNQYQYTNDRLSKITHNAFDVNFVYDNWGNTQSVRIGSQNLITNNYTSNNRIIE